LKTTSADTPPIAIVAKTNRPVKNISIANNMLKVYLTNAISVITPRIATVPVETYICCLTVSLDFLENKCSRLTRAIAAPAIAANAV
jgi:hypothetical protein